jgi:hypothetical protein
MAAIIELKRSVRQRAIAVGAKCHTIIAQATRHRFLTSAAKKSVSVAEYPSLREGIKTD